MESLIKSIYIAATFFGVGVILIDIIMSVSSVSDGEGADDDISGSEDLAEDAEGSAGEDDAVESGAEEEGFSHEKGSMVIHDQRKSVSLILKALSTLRSMVYFSFGFGATGWFAIQTGRSLFSSILWSIPVGISVAVIAKLFKRIQQNQLDSTIKPDELIFEKALVTVSIHPGKLGKIKAEVGNVYVERFARAKDPEAEFLIGSKVRISEVTDDVVYVEEMS